MRVVLRNPFAADGRDFRHSLTVGAEYEVLGIEGDSFRLLTDRGEPVVFDAACFEITDPTEPAFWVNASPGGTERYAYPPGWACRGSSKRGTITSRLCANCSRHNWRRGILRS